MPTLFGPYAAIAALLCFPAFAAAQAAVTQAPANAVNSPLDLAVCEVIDRPLRGTFKDALWPAGVVPYTFNDNVNATNRNRAINAMNELSTVARLTFIPRTDEPAYIQFNASTSSNSSPLGYNGTPNGIQIASWSWHYIIIHEIMHSLGIYHEQSSLIRGQYVKINWPNIEPGREHNFQLAFQSVNLDDYNFESIMHYGTCSFTVCGCASCPTISMQPGYEQYNNVIGNRSYLSDGDKHLLRFMYGGYTDDAHEPNDSPAQAAPITPGLHTLQLQDDHDYFRLTLTERSTVNAGVTFDQSGAQATLRILSPAGVPLAESTMSAGSAAIAAVLPAGEAIIHVQQDLGFDTYVLQTAAQPAPCLADITGDGTLTLDDVDAFAAAFASQDLAADLDANGILTLDDIDAFIASFLAGC